MTDANFILLSWVEKFPRPPMIVPLEDASRFLRPVPLQGHPTFQERFGHQTSELRLRSYGAECRIRAPSQLDRSLLLSCLALSLAVNVVHISKERGSRRRGLAEIAE